MAHFSCIIIPINTCIIININWLYLLSRLYLSQQELGKLEHEHRHTSDKRYADRLKAVYLRGSGWQVSQVAQALMIDRESVRNHHKRYRKGGLTALLRNEAGGSECALNAEQRRQLDGYLQQHYA